MITSNLQIRVSPKPDLALLMSNSINGDVIEVRSPQSRNAISESQLEFSFAFESDNDCLDFGVYMSLLIDGRDLFVIWTLGPGNRI